MKFGAALASACALALLTTEVDAGVQGGIGRYTKVPTYGHRHSNKSAYAQKRVNEERERMELVYGKGLVGLLGPDGKVDHKRFGWDNRRAQTVWVEINGKQYNGQSVEAFSLGYVQGVQYTPDNSKLKEQLEDAQDIIVMSNCFYAIKGVIGSVDTLIYDAKNMGQYSGQYNWFNMIFDPLHILGDTTVAYEMCNIYEDLDKLVGLLSMDWGLLSEQLTEIGMYMWLEADKLLKEIQEAMGDDCMKEVILLTNQAINDGLDEIEDMVNVGDTRVDVDRQLETLKDAGYTLEGCVITDINLYTVGNDLGIMISRMLQAQLDATN